MLNASGNVAPLNLDLPVVELLLVIAIGNDLEALKRQPEGFYTKDPPR